VLAGVSVQKHLQLQRYLFDRTIIVLNYRMLVNQPPQNRRLADAEA
jgi:hypothetical protein